jgi:hypothetical protein
VSPDLDQFNPISDSFGHAVGDMVWEISKRRGRCLREADALLKGSFRTAPGEPAVDPDTHPVAGAHRSAAPALVPVVLKSGGVANTVRRSRVASGDELSVNVTLPNGIMVTAQTSAVRTLSPLLSELAQSPC